MQTFAMIENNLVINMAKFDDLATPPTGWIDVTGIDCGIGWPVVTGVPLVPPTRWHTVTITNDGWEITPENQALKDEAEAEASPTNDEIYDATVQNQKLLKAVVLSLNDGTFVPGANISNSALKAIITAKM